MSRRVDPHFDKLQELLSAGVPFVAVTLVEAIGSTPADAGSKMLVTAEGRAHGTVGGGRVEVRAVAEAQSLLAETAPGQPRTRLVSWNLQTDIKMTCGGAVKLYFEVFTPTRWPIVIFGAGHVAQALVRTLLNLDCHLTVYDQREEWLARLPASPKLTTHYSPNLPEVASALPDSAFVLLMTQGHSVDAPVLVELLKRDPFPYLGVIGSAAKRAALKKNVLAAGIDERLFEQVHCPMGLDLGTNHPYEIALSIAAQLVQTRDALKTNTPEPLRSPATPQTAPPPPPP
jgi:xanthine dehydrogenase accessory factor